ncbi:MAG: metallophosphoesterase family protein [Armatimonadota bacterium]
MRAIRILHTADVHLDAPNAELGERASALRRATREAFARVIDLCLERDAHLLIVAGDLFDRARPDAASLDFALGQLRRLQDASPPVAVALLPGTHDCWREGGLWDSPRMRALGASMQSLCGPEAVSVHLSDLDLAIHGCAHVCGRERQRPLRALRPDASVALNVGVAHGSMERGDVADASMFDAAEIAATGMDYLALGHWHSWTEHTAGDVAAINPGSPEIDGFAQRDAGSVALVTLGEGPALVERVTVGALRGERISIDAADLGGTEDLITRISQYADESLLLHVTVEGLAAPGVVIDVQDAQQRLADEFFALRVADETHPAVADLDDIAADGLALGRFVELARERIEAAGDERERRVAERALQVGVAMLRGGGGVP